jgi:Kef-type K+ transport system membrane component KefB/mannitol/fructose-specific phosphotransferase system IIA component (Ntr-type)
MTGLDTMTLLLSLGVLLTLARLLGEAACRLGLPAVAGELAAGVLLGPTVLGSLSPDVVSALFPTTGPVGLALDGFMRISMVFFLFVAGLEVDLSRAFGRGGTSLGVAFAGVAAPLAIGFAAAWHLPALSGHPPGVSLFSHAFFVGVALAVSALPMVAKTLLDLGLFRSDFGMLVMASAVLVDVAVWTLFSVALAMTGPGGTADGFSGLGQTSPAWLQAVVTIGFAAALLTAGRFLTHRGMGLLTRLGVSQSGILGLALGVALLLAALSEALGAHAVLGAFLAGVCLGDSAHLRERARMAIMEFVNAIFVPLFIAAIGLHLDLARSLDPVLYLGLLGLALMGKFAGVYPAARLARLGVRESLATFAALNDRGAMAVILCRMGLLAGLCDERFFTAYVTVALTTSLLSGPAIRRLLKTVPRRAEPSIPAFLLLRRHLKPETFLSPLQASGPRRIVSILARTAARSAGLDENVVLAEVRRREKRLSTALGRGVAVPHARIAGLTHPVCAVGVVPEGVSMDSPDELPVNVFFLVLSPLEDDGAQLAILADIARAARRPHFATRAARTRSIEEFLHLLDVDGSREKAVPARAAPPPDEGSKAGSRPPGR